MGSGTPIEWTDATWNPVGGCSVKSPGCANCYAMKLAGTRLRQHPLYRGTTTPSKAGPVFNGLMTEAAAESVWTWPRRWRGASRPRLGPGMPSLIFVGDMADLFHESRGDAAIDRVIETAISCPQHIFQLLTKRADRMARYFGARRDIEALALRNLWLGVSVEDQVRAEGRRAPLAGLAGAGFTTFVSYEPALGPVDWAGWEFLAWLIAGGESGRGARLSHPNWFLAARDFCAGAGIPFFFKQWGEYFPTERAREIRLWDELAPSAYEALGKKRAGRLLEGRLHDGFPLVPAELPA